MEEQYFIMMIAIMLLLIGEAGYMIVRLVQKRQHTKWLGTVGQQHAFTKDELAFIKKQAERFNTPTIDAITWNDLELDRLYQDMNTCYSSAGDQCLYAWLSHPFLEEQDIRKRRSLMVMLQENEELRRKLYGLFATIGGQCESPIDEIYDLKRPRIPKTIAWLSLVFTIGSALISLVLPEVWLYTILLLIGNGVLSTAVRNAQAYAYESAFYLYRYGTVVHELPKLSLEPMLRKAFEVDEIAEGLKGWNRSLFPDIYEGDGLFLLLAKNILPLEMLTFDRLMHTLIQHQNEVRRAILMIGELDALLAAAHYTEHTACCKAGFHNELSLITEAMVHPYLPQPVSNDIEVKQNILISGSNASGKSTFLRTVAINALFAQCFGMAFAKRYDACCFQLYTSLSLKDSIERRESYFMSEVRAIKRILNHEKNVPLLCLIDEILSGTNTGERIAASSAILHECSIQNMLCIAATHDLELTQILAREYKNMHFQEELSGAVMQFPYKILEGPSNSQNALPMLKTLGFSQTMIDQSKHLRQSYERRHRWIWDEEAGK